MKKKMDPDPDPERIGIRETQKHPDPDPQHCRKLTVICRFAKKSTGFELEEKNFLGGGVDVFYGDLKLRLEKFLPPHYFLQIEALVRSQAQQHMYCSMNTYSSD
jgi:hypothetical protein